MRARSGGIGSVSAEVINRVGRRDLGCGSWHFRERDCSRSTMPARLKQRGIGGPRHLSGPRGCDQSARRYDFRVRGRHLREYCRARQCRPGRGRCQWHFRDERGCHQPAWWRYLRWERRYLWNAVTLDNFGRVEARQEGAGAAIFAGSADVTNRLGGVISGNIGIRAPDPSKGSTIDKAGAIIGTGGTAIKLTSAADTLTLRSRCAHHRRRRHGFRQRYRQCCPQSRPIPGCRR